MNKHSHVYTMVLIVTLLVSPFAALADPLQCTRTFDGESTSSPTDWHSAENWSGNQVPGTEDVVCITDTVLADFVYARTADCNARAIWVEEGALLEIYGENTLNLYGDIPGGQNPGDSTVLNTYIDGEFYLCPPFPDDIYGGVLKLKKSISFLASGSTGARTIRMSHSLVRIQAESGSGATMTIGSGVTLKGWGKVQLPIINNGKVIAQNEGAGGPTLLSIEAGGSGSGTWAAKTDTGHLHIINTAITGSGKWELNDHNSAKIEIDVASECLTGNVQVTHGTLDVDANFRSTGQLSMGWDGCVIDVSATTSAKFSGPTYPPCIGGGGGGD